MSAPSITTRAEALAALADLTATERAAVRWLIAAAHADGHWGRPAPFNYSPDPSRHAYARAALPPRTVTRVRPPVPDPHEQEAVLSLIPEGRGGYCVKLKLGALITPERAAIIADLLQNPLETVEVEE